MCDDRLDMRTGLLAPAALLNGGILADEEAECDVCSPLFDRLDHGEASAGCGVVQQCRSELHRILCYIRDEARHVGHREDGADRSA